ncbi:hypothetical protein SE17_11145 [Kouleothrix aurantiaca]|uniref:Uncharacterized protein n=1 Tax=Kouleothrix aurantiaca TaxID=186479 RepID=A0A0P9DBP2_9CHLR|nr:hypothetical protein SE17_11145 [Kouleothrix aurantiaca]
MCRNLHSEVPRIVRARYKETIVNKYQQEAERQRKARIAENKALAEDMFNPSRVRGVTPRPASQGGRQLAGVAVSELAYQLHSLLVGRGDTHEDSDAALASELNRHRMSNCQLDTEAIVAALEELTTAELVTVEVQADQRVLNPLTPRYLLG